METNCSCPAGNTQYTNWVGTYTHCPYCDICPCCGRPRNRYPYPWPYYPNGIWMNGLGQAQGIGIGEVTCQADGGAGMQTWNGEFQSSNTSGTTQHLASQYLN